MTFSARSGRVFIGGTEADGVQRVEIHPVPDDAEPVDLGLRYLRTMTIPMRLTKHGREMIERWVFGRGGPWKAAHARRYPRRGRRR